VFQSTVKHDEDLESLKFEKPKETLEEWLDDVGIELNMRIEQQNSLFIAHISIDKEALNCEEDILVTGNACRRKRDAERSAYLDACRRLASMGLLQPDKQQMKRIARESDEEEDPFFDRTNHTKKGKSEKPTVETFESLSLKHQELSEAISNLEGLLESTADLQEESDGLNQDELDLYLSQLEQTQKVRDHTRYKSELEDKRHELARVERLLKIVQPAVSDYVKMPPKLTSKVAILPRRYAEKELVVQDPKAIMTDSYNILEEQVEEWLPEGSPSTADQQLESLKNKFGY